MSGNDKFVSAPNPNHSRDHDLKHCTIFPSSGCSNYKLYVEYRIKKKLLSLNYLFYVNIFRCNEKNNPKNSDLGTQLKIKQPS